MIIEITRKKAIAFLALLVIVIAVPLTVYLSRQQQETRSRAADVPDSTVVAVIDGEQITKGQVREVAQESLLPSQVDSQALKDALATLEERMILDASARRAGITVDPVDVQRVAADEALPEKDAYYEVLKDKVILAEVNSRQANTIEFWNTPQQGLASLSEAEQTASARQLTDGNLALNEAQTRLSAGENPITIAESLISKYPSLAPVLAVNGYILSSLSDPENSSAAFPSLFQFGATGIDVPTRDALFGIQAVGGVAKATNTESNRGGTVFQLTSIGNSSGPATYDQWLAQQKATLSQNLGVL